MNDKMLIFDADSSNTDQHIVGKEKSLQEVLGNESFKQLTELIQTENDYFLLTQGLRKTMLFIHTLHQSNPDKVIMAMPYFNKLNSLLAALSASELRDKLNF